MHAKAEGHPLKELSPTSFFKCKAYNKEQHKLDCKMRRNSRDLSALLSTKKGVKALVSYVDKPKGEYPVS